MFCSSTTFSQLKINELMTNNVSAIVDTYYNYSMWVEVFNTHPTNSYNLSNFYFSDNRAETRKWLPRSKTIGPKSFGLVFFERSSFAGHANFRLEPEGGWLYLFSFGGALVDSVKYGQQKRNISFGRIADGGNEWVFFDSPSAASSNNVRMGSNESCEVPSFMKLGGFYKGSQTISFASPALGDSIYYTMNGDEPTRKNATLFVTGKPIIVGATTVVRAITVSARKLTSEIATQTYFINERNFAMAAVSLSTSPTHLFNNTMGIYVEGTNGITGNGMNTPANWNMDWDRPANFELYDKQGQQRLNQELDISIAGGWSRKSGQKSLKIEPKKKFGNNKLNYDFFEATKPGNKYKGILMRNSGNDFNYSMMRDAAIQSIVMKRMNLDYQAYEPAVCFINGVYYGIQNLRERTNENFIYSNYGLDETEIDLLEGWEMSNDSRFKELTNYLINNNISQPSVYAKVCEMMDMDNFISYMLTQMYFANTDWPHNNIKTWRKNEGGKWRWLLYDTEFGFAMYDANLHNFNAVTYVLGENNEKIPDAWSTLLMRRLVLNDTFVQQLIDKASVQLSTTFAAPRMTAIVDSLARGIQTEISFHKAKWGSHRSFADDIFNMKNFSTLRSFRMFEFLSSRFLNNRSTSTIVLRANIAQAQYSMNNETILDANADIKTYNQRLVNFKAIAPKGFIFKHWEVSGPTQTTPLISENDNWRYFDGNALPANNWMQVTYNDASWANGKAPLGYGNKGETTTISYGTNASNKNITAYFRKKLSIAKLTDNTSFVINAYVDDAVVVYVNGTEIGRYNLPDGEISFNTVANTYNNIDRATFVVPTHLMVEGENVIAAEVHQNSPTSSDLHFRLSMSSSVLGSNLIDSNEIYSTQLNNDMSLKAIFDVNDEVVEVEKIVINEVVSSNNETRDDFGDKDDYIELYNRSNESVNIAGWHITDTPAHRTLYTFANNEPEKTTIAPQSYLVLWADGQTEQGILHLNFKLSKEGETIVLSRPENSQLIQVDSVGYPDMAQNMSYARSTDGGNVWKVQAPTPNANNETVNANDEMKSVSIKMYPTVVTNSVFVTGASGKLIRIYDLRGHLMFEMFGSNQVEQISVQQLPAGLYVLRVDNLSFKMIK